MISADGLVNPAVNYGANATTIDGANTSMKEGAASGAPTGTGVNAAWKRTSVDIGIPVGAGFKPAQIKPDDSPPVPTQHVETKPDVTQFVREECIITASVPTQRHRTQRHPDATHCALNWTPNRRVAVVVTRAGLKPAQIKPDDSPPVPTHRDDSLNRIRQYIADNPAQWEFDQDNPNATLAESLEAVL
jgi:hypothetical protein